MRTYQFKVYPINSGIAQECMIAIDDKYYVVNVDGRPIGSMKIDRSAPFGFTTSDADLLPLIEEISGNILKINKVLEFPDKIKNLWCDNIIRTEYISEWKLIVECHPDTDLDEFGNVVKDMIYDIVEFEEHVDIVLTKKGKNDIFKIGVN